MQNFRLLAQKLSELWSILCFLRFYVFFVRKWLRAVKIYLHAKFRASSLKIERVMLNFVFFTFLRFFAVGSQDLLACKISSFLLENWASYAQFVLCSEPIPAFPVTNLPVKLCASRQLIIIIINKTHIDSTQLAGLCRVYSAEYYFENFALQNIT